MFDTRLRQLIDPLLNRMGAWVARSGIGANAITLTGAALVVPLFYSLLLQNWLAALALLAANRLLDGLDGNVRSHFTAGCSAHAVGYYIESNVGCDQERVLVIGPHAPAIRLSKRFKHRQADYIGSVCTLCNHYTTCAEKEAPLGYLLFKP